MTISRSGSVRGAHGGPSAARPWLEHYYQNIPGWFDFQDIYAGAVAEAEDGERFLEIGTFMGKSLSFLAVEIVNSCKRIELHSLDSVVRVDIDQANLEGDHIEAHKRWQGQLLIDVLSSNLLPVYRNGFDFELYWEHHTGDSVEQAHWFPDLWFDFIFLDTLHTYDLTSRELRAWWPKLKRGGKFGGHDHTPHFPGVQQACREFFTQGYQVKRSSFLAFKR